MSRIKVLQIVPSLSKANGISTFIIQYLRKIDLKEFEIEFLVMKEDKKEYYKEIEQIGCKIHEIKFQKFHFFRFLKKLSVFFKEHKYDIVHCHVPNFGFFTQYFAKKNKIRTRIIHSHAILSSGKYLNRLRNSVIEPIAVRFSTDYFACSQEAGVALFKDRPFTVINNAIDMDDLYFDKDAREKVRKELGIEKEEILIGTVGRLSKEKNQCFLIEIMDYLCNQKKEKCKLIFVGDGPEKEKLKKKSKELDLENKIIFTGVKNNVNDYYCAMDCFVLPSLAEGLGLVLIEAQITGLQCFASKERIPKKTAFTGNIEFLQLEKGKKYWGDKIISNSNKNRRTMSKEFLESEFYIKKEIKKLENYYRRSV